MNESTFPILSVQVPPRTGWRAGEPLCVPITPKCASRLTLPRTPPAMITTTNPISSAALVLGIRLALRWTGIVGSRGGDTPAAVGATTWLCCGVSDAAPLWGVLRPFGAAEPGYTVGSSAPTGRSADGVVSVGRTR